jgi:O-acetyl-ADP-ribose deacetylase (regulator of RNase III)
MAHKKQQTMPPPSNAPPPPSSSWVGRDSELAVCVESILNHRLTTIGGRYGSGKSALAAKAVAHVSLHRPFRHLDAVVWVQVTTHDRFFDDVIEAAAFINTSTLADLASAGRVLVVLNDFERLVTASDEQRAREHCRLLLQGLLETCSNIKVLLTCSSFSGIGLVRGVTEQIVALGPMAPGDTAFLLLQRNPELKRRVTNPFELQPPRIAPPGVVVACASHPFVKRLNGLPYAVSLAVLIINKLFASEKAAKDACEAAGAHKTLPPSSRLEPLDRALRVLDLPHDIFPGPSPYFPRNKDSDLRRLRDELNHVVQYGRGYRPEAEPEPEFPEPSTRASPWEWARSWFRSTSPSAPAPPRSASPKLPEPIYPVSPTGTYGGLVDNLVPLARHALKYGELVVSAGSVVDAEVDALVCFTDESCLGGDGQVARAGGALLAEKRQALPILSGEKWRALPVTSGDKRCEVGDAVVTTEQRQALPIITGDKRCEVGDAVVTTGGPFGSLRCDAMVHAVGPDYRKLGHAKGDELLRDTHVAAMRRAQENNCKTVAFPLLSAGRGRGTRSLENVLEVAVEAVGDMAYPGLQRVHLVAHGRTEQEVLQRVASSLATPPPDRLAPSRSPNRIVMLQSEPLNNSTVYVGDREIPLGKIGGLDLEGEANKLRQALREAAVSAKVDVELQVSTATVDAFQSAVTLGARVVHFAGHGEKGIMMFEDGHGGAHALEAKALRNCVSAGGAGTCKLVVLNSCKSEDVGRAFVAAGVEHVVAVAQDQNDGRISDLAGIEFCRAFYRSLAYMHSVRKAFDVGCAAAQNTRKNMASDGRFILLPEDKPHDEPIFSEIRGSFRETTPPPPPSNAHEPPTNFVGRDSELLVCVESILNHRLTTIGGRYGSGRSALAAKAAAHLRHHRKFDAVVWVQVTTHDRFFEDVAEAVAHVIERAEYDPLNPMNKRTMYIKTRSSSEDTAALDTSILADLASAGRVLVVLNDFERLVTAGDEQRAREHCRLLLQGLLETCSNIKVLLTCSSGSGIRLVRGVTEQVVRLGPMAPRDTAFLLLQRDPELKLRATNPYTPLPPKTAPHDVVVACALHPFIKRLKGLPYAVLLAVAILNTLFAAEKAEKEACEVAGACATPQPPSLEPLDRALRVLDEPEVFDSDLRRFRDELNYVVQYGRGYRPEPEPPEPSTPAPEFRAQIPGGLVLAGLAALVAGYALGRRGAK